MVSGATGTLDIQEDGAPDEAFGDDASRQVFGDDDRIQVTVGGEPLAPDRQVAVATTDLEFSEMIGYVVIDEARVAFEVPTIMAEMLEDYLALHWPLTPPTGPRMMAQATA